MLCPNCHALLRGRRVLLGLDCTARCERLQQEADLISSDIENDNPTKTE